MSITSLLLGGQKLLQLTLVVFVEVVKVLDLVTMGLLFAFGGLSVFTDNVFDRVLQLLDLLVVIAARLLEIGNVLLHLVLALFSHESLAHAVGDG